MANDKDISRRERLAEAAEELNEVLGLEPAIETVEASEEHLEEKLTEAVKLVAPSDEFSESTEKMIDEFLEEEVDEEEEEIEDEVEDTEAEEDEIEDEEFEDDEEFAEEEEYTLEEIREGIEESANRRDLRVFIQDFPDVFGPVIDDLPELDTHELLEEAALERLDEFEAEPEAGAEEIEDEEEFEDEDEIEDEETGEEVDEDEEEFEEDEEVEEDEETEDQSSKPSTLEYIQDLIDEGTHTRKEIIEQTTEELGVSASTVRTYITDGKNPDYNKFAEPVIETEEGVVKFDE